ncbi:hypothetical protein LOK49_LG03G03536 [Camellia lanceoleosa]|uniref:Uncharacterized protein n=1 Tax=Camellia lanceoleosa TaxID=1840588 RepID=A0ACC0I529_9ERIC|nr:hypothetical protein LOK49_LG03G03536 [Camellia lanceoleosa]
MHVSVESFPPQKWKFLSYFSSFFFSLVTVHQNNCQKLLDRAHDVHNFKSKTGLYLLQHLYY